MASKIVFVTGGNSGVGYEAVKAFLESDKKYHVFMGSRSLDKAKEAIDSLHAECPEATNLVEPVQLDLTSDESIEKAFAQVQAKLGHIDALVNNAGKYAIPGSSLSDAKVPGATFDLEYVASRMSLRDSFNDAYDVNVTGAQVMTATFMPLLLKSTDPRLVFVTGLSHINQAAESYFPTPPQPRGWPKSVEFETIGYRCSKLAICMLMLDWNHKLQADGVKVWCVDPGMLLTNLGKFDREKAIQMGAKHPYFGNRLLKNVVEGERDNSVGKIVDEQGVRAW